MSFDWDVTGGRCFALPLYVVIGLWCCRQFDIQWSELKVHDLFPKDIWGSWSFNHGMSNMMSNLARGVTKQNNSSRCSPKVRIVRATWVIFPLMVSLTNRNLRGFAKAIRDSLWYFANFMFMKLFADASVSVKHWVFVVFCSLRTLASKFNYFPFCNSASYEDRVTIASLAPGPSSSLILMRTCFSVSLAATSSGKASFSIVVIHRLEAHLLWSPIQFLLTL